MQLIHRLHHRSLSVLVHPTSKVRPTAHPPHPTLPVRPSLHQFACICIASTYFSFTKVGCSTDQQPPPLLHAADCDSLPALSGRLRFIYGAFRPLLLRISFDDHTGSLLWSESRRGGRFYSFLYKLSGSNRWCTVRPPSLEACVGVCSSA